MRIVVALGGNALLERGEVAEAQVQEKHVVAAVKALVPLVQDHDLLITHGNGPQVGLLALESERDPDLPHPYPFDVLGAQTQGMIGYFLLQAFENALPGQEVVSLVCQTMVDTNDPAFAHPTKFVGPVYDEEEAQRIVRLRGWAVRPDGQAWRRVVASPEPLVPLEMPTIRMLMTNGAIVICAGGGGIPVARGADGLLHGVEAVIDKDLTAVLMARELDADALLLLTDVASVELDFGTDSARPLHHTTPEALRAMTFPSGSMGPKVDAACRFVEATNRRAFIGRLDHAVELLDGRSGTVVGPASALPAEDRRRSQHDPLVRDRSIRTQVKEQSVTTTEQPSHRIVVGIDGSLSSVAALKWAMRQAHLIGSTVEAITTWEWPMAPAVGMMAPDGFDPKGDAQEVLEKVLAPERVGHEGVSIDSKIVGGPAELALVDASRGADLLVIGSRGHSELVSLLLGSVSEHCVSHAHCPVVVIRDGHNLNDDV